MTNTIKLQEVRSAENAQSLIDNKELTDAFSVVERQYLDAMLTANEKDDLARFRYAEAIKVVRMVRQQLAVTVQNGKLSAIELAEISGEKKSLFRRY